MSVKACSEHEREAWLAANAVWCERWNLRLSPMTCERYRTVYPLRCAGCERLGEPAKTELIMLPSGGAITHRRRDQARENMSKSGECKECGRVKTLPGRGLCGVCYNKVLAAEKAGVVTAVAQTAPVQPPPPQEPDRSAELSEKPIFDTYANPTSTCRGAQSPRSLYIFFQGRDARLLEALAKIATEQRRTVEAQLLCLLESALVQAGAVTQDEPLDL